MFGRCRPVIRESPWASGPSLFCTSTVNVSPGSTSNVGAGAVPPYRRATTPKLSSPTSTTKRCRNRPATDRFACGWGRPKRTVPTGGGAVATIAALATNETTMPSRMAAPPQVLNNAARCAGELYNVSGCWLGWRSTDSLPRLRDV